jgi:hypothetical protein
MSLGFAKIIVSTLASPGRLQLAVRFEWRLPPIAAVVAGALQPEVGSGAAIPLRPAPIWLKHNGQVTPYFLSALARVRQSRLVEEGLTYNAGFGGHQWHTQREMLLEQEDLALDAT